MNKYIEVISEFKPKNGQQFAIADVNDLRGGYIQVETIEEMEALLSTNKLKYGMLCYVKVVPTDMHMYIYRNQWELWEGQGGSGGGGLSLVQVENLEELVTKTGLQVKGQIVYINDIDDLRFWNGQYWESFRKIYIQSTEPDDKGGIWIDTSERGFTRSTDIIQDMLRVMNILQQKVERLMYMQTEIDPGDFTNNQSTSLDGEESERPNYGTSEEEDNETQYNNSQVEIKDGPEPDDLDFSPNTKVIKVKSGTQAYMKAHEEDFAERELLWCYDTQTLWIKDPKTYKLVRIGATGGGSEEEIDDDIMDGIIQKTIGQYKRITGIEFADMENESNLYMLRVKNGQLKLIDKTVSVLNTQQQVNNDGTYTPMYYPLGEHSVQESPLIYINMVYCGGDDNKYSYNPVSHSFIELCNISTQELNLNGLYLHYTEGEATPRLWVTLPLTGRIKAGGTFLIRGAACSVYDTNTTLIKVGEPDMYWTKDQTKNPMVCEVDTDEYQHSIWDDEGYLKLSRTCSIYLSGGYEETTQQSYSLALTTPFDSQPLSADSLWKTGGYVAKYYIDLLGIGAGSIACSSPFDNTKNNMDPKNCLIFRYYNMDPVKQALKTPKDQNNNNNAQWTYFNLARINENVDIQKYVPKNSKQGKTIFFNKADLVEGPNVVTCTFGYDAHKTRCFNWISKDYYDEYIKIWTDSEENAEIYESFKEGDGRASNGRNWDSPIYNRIRNVATNGVAYTVHKFIMDFNLPTGVSSKKFYYKVGREGHWSTTHSFTLRSRQSVIQNGFQWVQVTDQQGFHDEEYKTWGIVSEFIKADGDQDADKGYDFIMNTGDQTQNGNRINEWLAYYRDSAEFYRDREQMFVIGNNDLCSKDPLMLGTGEDINKVNPENINFFFTYEHPYGLPTTPEGKYIPSIFSFIYGDTYFLGMNSEFTNTSQLDLFGVDATYQEEQNGPMGIYACVKTWCDSELTHLDNQIVWKVAFTHDNPFTLLTKEQIYGKKSGGTITYTYLDAELRENINYSRGGSHLNSVGGYWFSKFLEDNNFRLCIGGHKHTYTCSRPMRDNPVNRMKPFVYDKDYSNDTVPSWYNGVSGPKEHLMQWGPLYDSNNNELTYVRYVTLQATGYKTTSNKELPHADVPWLSNYYPAGDSNITDQTRFTADSKNGGQNYPHYILWRVGEGTEVTDASKHAQTARPIILGRVYKVQPSTNRKSGWVYTYNIPYSSSVLEKISGNGSGASGLGKVDDNIIVELSYANPPVEIDNE